MITREYCLTLSGYNIWQNRNLYSILSSMEEAEWKKDHGVFFKSLQGTLNHLLYSDRVWLDRFYKKEVSLKDPKVILAESIADWTEARKKLDEEIHTWISGLTNDWLAKDLAYFSYAYNKELVKPAWLLVTHLFNHQTHHRSQATSVLNQIGLNYGVTDLPMLP
ncbi:damage-inducible protein DinB [Leptospira kobayashii]|uniref:Damage-inducible protein DinB n=1 Tax=Leptospira kobayashii TaxID=1917830 RepID=A0ABN6KEK6_9LEPT|nr:DinB family protein [Leptospira kobayashii]BDA77802.1 damage-inducible protein DinB [Leptospira kobayashii]